MVTDTITGSCGTVKDTGWSFMGGGCQGVLSGGHLDTTKDWPSGLNNILATHTVTCTVTGSSK